MFLQFERNYSTVEVYAATKDLAEQYITLYEGMDFALVYAHARVPYNN